MQREITNRNTLADTLNPINDARRSTGLIEQLQIIMMRKKKFKKLEI